MADTVAMAPRATSHDTRWRGRLLPHVSSRSSCVRRPSVA
jgi:hypothetical protein